MFRSRGEEHHLTLVNPNMVSNSLLKFHTYIMQRLKFVYINVHVINKIDFFSGCSYGYPLHARDGFQLSIYKKTVMNCNPQN